MALDKRFFKELSDSVSSNQDAMNHFIQSDMRKDDLEYILTIAIIRILNASALTGDAQVRIVNNVCDKLLGSPVIKKEESKPVESLEDTLKEHKEKEEPKKETPAPAKQDEAIKTFTELMDALVKKNKGRKKITGLSEMRKLITVISDYKGDVKVLKDIKTSLTKHKTEADKLKTIESFIKTVIK